MKNRITIHGLSVLFFFLISFGIKAQVSTGVNFSLVNTDYSGWNSFVTFPLDVRHQGPYAINFYTDSLFRMTIDSANGLDSISM